MIPDSIAPLVRRWYVLLVGLLATLGLAYTVSSRVEPTYSTQASVLLIPAKATVPIGGNPFLYLGGLSQARDVVVRDLGTQAFRSSILDDQGGDFAITADPTSSAPMFSILSTGATAREARTVRRAVLDALESQVLNLQSDASVPQVARFKTFIVADDSEPVAETKTRFRMLLATVVVGTGVTVLAAALIDAALRGRRTKRRGDSGDSDEWVDGRPSSANDPGDQLLDEAYSDVRAARLDVESAPVAQARGGTT